MSNAFQDFYQGRKVLVTGHTGFKGSWLTEWLLTLGAKVTGFSLPPPTTPALFAQIGLANRCDHRIGDIRDAPVVHRVIHEVRPDVIFHLAAQSLVRRSYEQPLETLATNIQGTAHVLDALRDADWPCAAVMITTDKVYENHEWLYAYRECDPLGGYDPYSASKACAELVIQSYRSAFFNPRKDRPQVAVASARAGNVIGGGDWAQDRIMPDAIRALMRAEAIPVRNPTATRPWQHVLEPLSGYLLLGARLHLALTERPADLQQVSTAFNFGPDLSADQSVRTLVEEVLKHWPGQWVDRSAPDAPHEAQLLNLATDKAWHVLGWRPRWCFEQTVHATTMWYRVNHEQGASAAALLTRQQLMDFQTTTS